MCIGVDGRKGRQRVVREVELAESLLMAPAPPASPLVRLLTAALPDERPSTLPDQLARGDLSVLGADAEWVASLLGQATAIGPIDPHRTAAWRSTSDPCVRALLLRAWPALLVQPAPPAS